MGIILFSAVVFFGLIFTSANGAILCNTFLGEQNEIELNTPVIRAYDSTAGRGNITYHHVVFKHPYQKRQVDIYVKQRYETGEMLTRKMLLGSLGMFYSK